MENKEPRYTPKWKLWIPLGIVIWLTVAFLWCIIVWCI